MKVSKAVVAPPARVMPTKKPGECNRRAFLFI
jgi:hypothetical protein